MSEAHKDETEVKLALAMHALDAIRFATGNMPDARGDAASWYRSRFYDCVATASAALRDIEDGDGRHDHARLNDSTDRCARCHKDLRHWSHTRLRVEEIIGSV